MGPRVHFQSGLFLATNIANLNRVQCGLLPWIHRSHVSPILTTHLCRFCVIFSNDLGRTFSPGVMAPGSLSSKLPKVAHHDNLSSFLSTNFLFSQWSNPITAWRVEYSLSYCSGHHWWLQPLSVPACLQEPGCQRYCGICDDFFYIFVYLLFFFTCWHNEMY